MAEEVGEAAAEPFLDGFPLGLDLGQAAWSTCTGTSALPAAPFSVLSRADAPAGPPDTLVSVDNDASCSVHLVRRITGAVSGAFLSVPGMYPSPPEALAGHVHEPPRTATQPG